MTLPYELSRPLLFWLLGPLCICFAEAGAVLPCISLMGLAAIGALNLSNVNFGSRNWKGSHRPSMSIRYILGDARFKNGRWTPPSKHLPKTTFRAKQFWHSNTSLCYISICTNIRRLVTFFDAAFLFRSFLPTTILGSLVQNCQG